MPTFDATAKAQLNRSYKAPAWFLFLDVVGDPIRATTYGKAVTFAGTGDADLDGQTYAVPSNRKVLKVGNVSFTENGSDTLSILLSGLVSIDTALMNEMGDRTKWLGRTARLWCLVFDETGAQQGAIASFYTGTMAGLDIHPSAKSQTIELKIENYVAILNQASNRSWLGQADFDPADTSAAATLAAANGSRGAAGAAMGGGGSGGAAEGGLGRIVSV